MVFDSQRGRSLLFGGETMGHLTMGDTWQWDGIAWKLAATTGPGPRKRHAMAYDLNRGVTVLFGGGGTWETGDDTWVWDGEQWTLASEVGPPPRSLHAMSYDSARGVVVLFGGEGQDLFGDTWEWDGEHWRLAASTGPEPRRNCGMAYDSDRGVTVMFGGSSEVRYGDTWEWDGLNWVRVSEDGPVHLSSALRQFSMTFDPDRHVTVLVGSTREQAETWQWDGLTWEQVAVGAPTPRWESAMAYDSLRKTTVIFSGSLSGWRGDTWELAFPIAPQLETSTGCPYSGNSNIQWSCSTPGGRVAVLFALAEGQVIIPPSQPCAGVSLGLSSRALQLAFTARSDSLGAGLREVHAPRGACDGVLQLVDLQTCATSPVVSY